MTINRTRRWLIATLAVSCGLRVWLACLGGQGYWPDEDRYASSQHAVYYLRHALWRDAAVELAGHADHPLFRWVGLPPAFFEAYAGPHPSLVAAYFGLYSVLAIFLVWAVALRAAGGDGAEIAAGPREAAETEALWAAFLAACANSLFYYSRHFFPYDVALCAMLWALWLGMGGWSWLNSLLVGVIVAAGFLSYNGYWWLGGSILILHALLGQGGARRIVSRALAAGAGLVLPILGFAGMGAALGHNLVAEDSQWGSLVRGDFPFGHRVIAGYLWYAEGGLLVIWLAALAYAVAQACRARRWGRLAWHAGGLVLVLGGLLFLSDVVPLFRIQGRQVRELVPFLCLGAAVGIAQFVRNRARGRRAWSIAIAVLVGGCAAWNFSVPLRQVFPDGFRRLASATIARQPAYHAYRLTFVENLWGAYLDSPISPQPPILRRSHPMQFRPYQYEGWDRGQRAELNRHDLAMRLIGWPGSEDAADPRWRGFPGPVRLVVRFPTTAAGLAEPLVTTGQTGRGDLCYLRYVDARHVTIGLDHWGVRATVSAPIEVDYARPHEIVLCAGFLLPPPDPSRDEKDRGQFLLRDRLLIVLDGRPVFSMAETFYPVPRGTIVFGINLIGGSVARPSFTGDILEFGSVPAPALASALAILAGGPAR